MGMRYLKNVVTLALDETKCTGCGRCLEVCPHAVFAADGNRVKIRDRDGCMECGACMRNCAFGAVTVRPGVGCAWAIVSSRLRGSSEPSCGEAGGGCSGDPPTPGQRGGNPGSGCACGG